MPYTRSVLATGEGLSLIAREIANLPLQDEALRDRIFATACRKYLKDFTPRPASTIILDGHYSARAQMSA